MNSYCTVQQPGLFTSIQDLGRSSAANFGIPRGGAMDAAHASLANALVGNHSNAALLECTFQGPKIVFHAPTFVALTGGDMQATLNELPILLNTVYQVEAGAILKMKKATNGPRTYIAIHQGFQTPKYLGSRSWAKNLTPQFRLAKGDKLSYIATRSMTKINKSSESINIVRDEIKVEMGPEWNRLSQEVQHNILNQKYQISPQGNRMAFPFVHAPVAYPDNLEMLTQPVLPGVVQLTPAGQLLALMREGQVTGGYPRVLFFPEKSMNQLAQMPLSKSFSLALID